MKKIKPIPTFTSEEEEREFWSDHDATDFIDFSEAKQVRKDQGFNVLMVWLDESSEREQIYLFAQKLQT